MYLAGIIDHTLLKPEATVADIERLCAEAIEYGFAAVCVDGSWVEFCARSLATSEVKVVGVVGFPTGATTSITKATQAAELVGLGADEIDMVAPIGRIIDGDWDYVKHDIAGVVQAVGGLVVKVILETAALNPTQIVTASTISAEAGAQFVKTSTGFHPTGGATEDAVAMMAAAVGTKLGVKAAGGIRDRETALRMIAAGATRIGTSKGVELVSGVQLT
jgi:deoxyribose-phosphate aldolase